jgi:hypothetical protein
VPVRIAGTNFLGFGLTNWIAGTSLSPDEEHYYEI